MADCSETHDFFGLANVRGRRRSEYSFADELGCDQFGPYEHPLEAVKTVSYRAADSVSEAPACLAMTVADYPLYATLRYMNRSGMTAFEPNLAPARYVTKGAAFAACGATTAVAAGVPLLACHVGRGYNITIKDFEAGAANSWYLRYLFMRVPYCKGDYYRENGQHLIALAAINDSAASVSMLIDNGFKVDGAYHGPFTSHHSYSEHVDSKQTDKKQTRVDEYTFYPRNAAGAAGAKSSADVLEVIATHYIRNPTYVDGRRVELGGMTDIYSNHLSQTRDQLRRSQECFLGYHWGPYNDATLFLTPFMAAAFNGCVDGLRRVCLLFTGEELKQLLNHSGSSTREFLFTESGIRSSVVTPVFMAIVGNRPECLDFLLSQELTDKDFLVDGNRSYLFFATLYNRVKCVQVLLKHRADYFMPEFSPFIIAAKGNQLKILHLLYNHSQEYTRTLGGRQEWEPKEIVKLADDEGKTAAYHAANNGHKDALDRVVIYYDSKFITRKDALANLDDQRFGGFFKLLVFAGIGAICCAAFWANFTYGEINYNCIRYYDNILLQPYLVIFLNTIVFLFVQSGLDTITKTYYATIRLYEFFSSYCCGVDLKNAVDNASKEPIRESDEEEQQGCSSGFQQLQELVTGKEEKKKEDEVPKDGLSILGWKIERDQFIGRFLTKWEDVSEAQTRDRYKNEVKTDERYVADGFMWQFFWIFFYIQFANAIVAIVVAFIKSDVASSRLSRWERYEDIFAVIVNSGVSSFVVSAYLIHIVRPEQIKKVREWVVQLITRDPDFEERPFSPELGRRMGNLIARFIYFILICLWACYNLLAWSAWLLAVLCGTFFCLSGVFVAFFHYATTTFLWTLGFAISTVLFFAYLDGYTLVPTCLTAFAPLLLVALVQLFLGLVMYLRGLYVYFGDLNKGKGESNGCVWVLGNGIPTFFFAAVVAMIGFKLDFPVESQWLPWRVIAGIMWFTWLLVCFFSLFFFVGEEKFRYLNFNSPCYVVFGFPFVIGFSMYAWISDVGSALSPFPFYSYFIMQQIWSFLSALILFNYSNPGGDPSLFGAEEIAGGNGKKNSSRVVPNGNKFIAVYGFAVSWWQSMLVVFVATKAYPSLTSYSLVMIPTYLFLFGAAAEHFFLLGVENNSYPSNRAFAWVTEVILLEHFLWGLVSNDFYDPVNYLAPPLKEINLHPDPYLSDKPIKNEATGVQEPNDDLMAYTGEDRTFWRSFMAEILIFLPALFILPPIVTHVIPGLFVFAWISIPVMTLAYLSYYCSREDFHRNFPSVVRYFLRLQYEVSSRFVAIFLLQVLYNYSSILYSKSLPISPSDYIDVITFDYKIRTQSYCFFNSLWEGVGKAGEANARTIITFMAWL